MIQVTRFQTLEKELEEVSGEVVWFGGFVEQSGKYLSKTV